MSDFATFTASYERYRQTLTKANALNKAIIFKALAAAGITERTIDFDGEGDSGQIDGFGARAGGTPVTVPATSITLHDVVWNSDQIKTVETTLPDAIETLCYAYLVISFAPYAARGRACSGSSSFSASSGVNRGMGNIF